jgi:type II secretory ATPase GspE/PulE/Tfp pilus assembly ATPase PilB-like protein
VRFLFGGKKEPEKRPQNTGLSVVGATALQAAPAPATASGGAEAAPLSTPVVDAGAPSVIQSAAALPKGDYLSFRLLQIPTTFAEQFLLLRVDEKEVLLIIAQEAWASHSQFELIKQLRARGLEVRQMERALGSVIQAVHRLRYKGEFDSQSSVETQAWALIHRALEAGASDLHIETRNTYAQIFFRVYGERHEQANITYEEAYQICSVLYVVHADSSSKNITWSPDRVMDTSIEHTTEDGRSVTIRFSSAPIHPGRGKNFHCVLRLLRLDNAHEKSLESLGYTKAQIDAIEDMIVGSQGCVLLVGPTNSGKSTSMQAIMRRIYDRRGPSIKAITIEKPVEYVIDNACQMGVNDMLKDGRENENPHDVMIRATLRQDPDVVMVGEIRDREEAEPVKNLVLAGRKLLSTLHVYESMAVFDRLVEMGIPRGILTMEGFISGVIYQRLVPRMCPKCSEPVSWGYRDGRVRKALWERLKPVAESGVHQVRIRSEKGCPHCNHTGIIGRVPCAEVLVPDSEFLDLVRAEKMAVARQHWQTHSPLNIDGIGVTALAHGVRLMLDAKVDPRDLETQVGILSAEIMEAARTAPVHRGPELEVVSG